MSRQKFQYKCFKCNKVSETDKFCQCAESPYYNYQMLVYDYQTIKNKKLVDFKSGLIHGLDKYLPLLPNNSFKYTLGEGNTPILKFNRFGKIHGFNNLYVKNEMTNPTGCFKDRETAVVINLAEEGGKNKLAVVSSGNAAVSAAAYSNAAGLECICFIPDSTSAGKKKLLEIFGTKFSTVSGEYEDIFRYLIDHAAEFPGYWNITSGANAFKEEGNKTISFEIFEQLGMPDKIVVPVGNGGLLFGLYKGFWELKQLGVIDRLPEFIGVQVIGNAPVAEAIRQGKDFIHIDAEPQSIAEGGIAAQDSFYSPLVIHALKQTGGQIIEITDSDLIVTLKELITLESFLTEPTSLASFAALSKIDHSADEKVVCIATGNAFKNLQEIFDILNGNFR